jgi:8-oxo-dGTP diphosphatase
MIYSSAMEIVVSRGLVQNNKGEILLLRRSLDDPSNKGVYEFPGGKVDPGEDIISAGVREIKQETNLDVAFEEIIYGYSLRIHNDRYPNSLYTLYVSKVRFMGGELMLSEEHDHYLWVSADCKLDLPTKPEVTQTIQFYQQ